MKNKNINVGSIVEVFNRDRALLRGIIGDDLNGHVMKVAGVLEHRNAYLLVRATPEGPQGGYQVHESNVKLKA
jgi:hypothetical protein